MYITFCEKSLCVHECHVVNAILSYVAESRENGRIVLALSARRYTVSEKLTSHSCFDSSECSIA